MAKIGIISFYNLDILDNGGKIRSYNIIKELNKEHKVFLLMPKFKGTESRKSLYLSVLRLAIPKKDYIRKYFTFISRGIKFFKKEKIDILICESLWTLPVGAIISRFLKIPLILNEQNLEYLRSIRLKKYIRFLYSTFLEFLLIQTCDYVLCVSKYEKKKLEKIINKNIKCFVLPNGTPTIPSKNELIKKGFYKNKIIDKYGIKRDKLISIFIGDLSYSPNIQALNILNVIARKYHNSIKIFVIGKSKNSILLKKKYKNLIFTGYVKNLNKFLYGADFTIIPIESGGGTNLKIYEALAVGLPIITSRYAIQNVEINNKSQVLVADGDYEKKVEVIINILNENNYKRKIDDSYNWEGYVKNFLNNLNLK